MSTEDIDLVVGALDSLGVVAADHKHQWSDGERAVYEEAIKILWNEFDKVKHIKPDSPSEPLPDTPQFT